MKFCFLISSERSGSNLITRLMDGHSRVCGPSPTHLFRVLLEYLPRYGDLTEPERWQLLLTDTVALAQTKLGEWRSSVSVEELASQVDRGSIAGVLRYVYEKEARAHGKQMLFVKENHLHRYFPLIDRLIPGSKFVFLVRDPRDMALSWKRAPNARGCVIRAAETWKSDQCASLALWSALLDSGRVVGLRYEDLVASARESLSDVCDLLGLEFEEGMLRLEARPGSSTDASSTGEWANLRKPIMTGNFGKYRDALTPDEIRFIEGTCIDEMKALGYPLDFPRSVSLASLRSAIQPLELHTKPQYQDQDEDVKRRHARRVAIIQAMQNRAGEPHRNWCSRRPV